MLSKQLSEQYGKGWSEKQLRHCIQFASIFNDETIVSTLWRQLSWSHLKLIIYVDAPLKREFYIEMCKLEKWSVRTFQERINSMLYERTSISKMPEKTIETDLSLLKNEKQLSTALVFRDPYVLDFLDLQDMYSEKDLETSIIVELQRFINELGSDFAFMARQKRIVNVRSKIVEEHLLDPKYFNEMSVLLTELIEARKRAAIIYQEYLIKMANLIRMVNKGKKEDVPKTMNTKGKVALYHTLNGDEELTLLLEKAVQHAKQEGFRDNVMKQRKVKNAIKRVLEDDTLAEEVYQIVEQHKEDY